MESALIVSSYEKNAALFSEMLHAASIQYIVTLGTCGEARCLLMEREFDLVIIDAPLQDESGESLAQHIAEKGMMQVILLVKSEFFEEISAATENYGVLTVCKPIQKSMFWSALKFARSTATRLKNMQAENHKLKQKIEDIRIVDRAKCVLVAQFAMTEQEAHRYIEKKAMDERATKRAVAEEILALYENQA